MTIHYATSRFEKSCYLIFLALFAAISVAFLQACDSSQVLAPPQIDSAKSASGPRQTIQYHDIQVCASGPSYRLPNGAGAQKYDWYGSAVIGSDMVELGTDSLGRSVDTCQSLGLFPDSTHFSLQEIGGLGVSPDSAWFLIDSSTQKLWIPWRRIVLHPDSLRSVADSLIGFRRHGLGVTP